MTWLKNKMVAALVAAAVALGGLFVTFGDTLVEYFAGELAETHEAQAQIKGIKFFEEKSRILDYKIDEGRIYFKYKTCWLSELGAIGDYRYRTYINGVPSPEIPIAPEWYNIGDWQEPSYCTEGWWGNRGWELPEHGGRHYKIRQVWQWRIMVNERDIATEHTVMEFVTGHK